MKLFCRCAWRWYRVRRINLFSLKKGQNLQYNIAKDKTKRYYYKVEKFVVELLRRLFACENVQYKAKREKQDKKHHRGAAAADPATYAAQ